jgi:hypothetical protein
MGPEGVRELSDRRHPPSVLVCVSEPQSVRALKAVLRQAGLEVYATHAAEEALTRAVTKPFRRPVNSWPDSARTWAGRQHSRMGRCSWTTRVRIRLAAGVLQRGRQQIRLTPIEYQLLSTLVRNRGRLLTHEALPREVWGSAFAEEPQILQAHWQAVGTTTPPTPRQLRAA